MTQKVGESADLFIARFKIIKNKCKILLPETMYAKMAQRGLDIELRKKFQGMEFQDFYELAVKVSKYEELLKEENQRKKAFIGIYFQKVSNIGITIADLASTDLLFALC